MTTAPVTLEVADDVARIALARPDRGNAIDLELAHALLATIEKLDTGLGAVVLSGEGDSFCVGGDLRAFAAAPAPSTMIAELAATSCSPRPAPGSTSRIPPRASPPTAASPGS
jgi:2-(1,2-epoxy-1,2-dihydrophenyl)acetyl-CoA isomerase